MKTVCVYLNGNPIIRAKTWSKTKNGYRRIARELGFSMKSRKFDYVVENDGKRICSKSSDYETPVKV